MAKDFPSIIKSQLNNWQNLEVFVFFQDYKTAASGSFNKFILQNTDGFS